MRFSRLLATMVLAGVCSAQSNVLLLIADDVGVDRVAAYAEHPDPGNTPVIDALAAGGVLFRNAWSAPLCSPTRAGMLTGRLGFRTGVGYAVQQATIPGLSSNELSLPEVIAASGSPHRVVALGKWHLGTMLDGPAHPLQSGFEVHAGSFGNLPWTQGGNYFSWAKSVNGNTFTTTKYATTDTVDDALRAIRALPEPWVLWVAFNASHKPFHAPPDDLHSIDLTGAPSDGDLHRALTEALDTEIGRLLTTMDQEVRSKTTVILVGDNGTPGSATEDPFPVGHAKGTVFEGGVNVPLIVSGAGVERPGSECAALVQTTDLFGTILELAEVAPPDVTLDSISIVPYLVDPWRPSLRSYVYTEHFFPNGAGPYLIHHRAARGPRYKLIQNLSGGFDRLYDLELDPFEASNLLAQPLSPGAANAYRNLSRYIEEVVRS